MSRRAYRAVSELGQLSLAAETRLFRALSGHFERLSGALDFMRKVHLRPELHSGPYRQVLRQMDLF